MHDTKVEFPKPVSSLDEEVECIETVEYIKYIEYIASAKHTETQEPCRHRTMEPRAVSSSLYPEFVRVEHSDGCMSTDPFLRVLPEEVCPATGRYDVADG